MNMQDEVLRILTFYHGDNNFNMNPYIPEDIEHYARAALDISDDDYLVAAIRLSFTKFHRGLIFSRDGIYWRNGPKVETNVNHFTWKELSERRAQFRTQPRTINLGDGAVIDNTGSMNKTSAVINLLDLLIDKYNQQEAKSDGFIFDTKDAELLARSIPLNKAQLKSENTQTAIEAHSGNSFIVECFKKLFNK
jgi:hypothetical protein